jgi:hypothetical protein
MAQEMSESRKQFIDFMLEVRKQSELVEAKERINEKVEGLQKELREIVDRAYQTAIGEKVGEYQEKANAEGLTPDELEAIQQERKEFEANPEAYGIVREKCPIKDETDKKRALEIVELLKDTKQLGKAEETDFLKMIDGYGDRQLSTMTEGQKQQIGTK